MNSGWIVAAAMCGLWGCDALQPDKSNLWATSSAPAERPRCDACHGFAPRTGAHRFHLDTLRVVDRDQHITCMDCHSASIAFSKTTVMDTTFFNDDILLPSNHSSNFPWMDFVRGEQFEVNPIDSMPIAWAPREPGAENPYWITAQSKGPGMPGHANGTVDVVFSERSANWTDGDEVVHRASWNPKRLSCNAVACHGSHAADTVRYVWKNVEEATP